MLRKYQGFGCRVLFAALLVCWVAPGVFSDEIPTPTIDQKDLSFYQPPASGDEYSRISSNKVRNVIMFIGDGMGLAEVSSARIRALGADGKLNFERMPITGFVKTHSLDSLVTDSAAAGTALATGYKTNNKMISALPDGTKLSTVLEASQKKGMRTGLVVTCTMSHATPASFASHVTSRGEEPEIALQMLGENVNVLFGGGRKYFLPVIPAPLPENAENGARKDGRNLLEEAKKIGYALAYDKQAMADAKGDFVLGLFNNDALTTAGGAEPALAEMTQKAISLLDRKKSGLFKKQPGFFMMVEGSQIDWAGHENDLDRSVRQTLLLDQAVKVALDFAKKDRGTLVLVTADHETGGMAVKSGSLNGESYQADWTAKGHTGIQVPLYAYGPGSERFAGVHDNTEIPKTVGNLLHLSDFPKTGN